MAPFYVTRASGFSREIPVHAMAHNCLRHPLAGDSEMNELFVEERQRREEEAAAAAEAARAARELAPKRTRKARTRASK